MILWRDDTFLIFGVVPDHSLLLDMVLFNVLPSLCFDCGFDDLEELEEDCFECVMDCC
jgi:hypothetical protein